MARRHLEAAILASQELELEGKLMGFNVITERHMRHACFCQMKEQ